MATEDTSTQMHKAPADDVTDTRVEQEMEQSYIDYAMSVIAGRSLPDVRDGLKPVQRRVLYAMHEEGLSSGSAHQKSASVVGDTMKNFHPHGDSSIYDALVRMGQEFSLRAPLIDGQGNFGSIDGDPAAAMRYTESRLSSVGEALLDDLDEYTVDFEPNYDGRTTEPTVLPAQFPNLLVNGASGIAVGMSTEIPPHNLGEVIDATIELIDNPEAGVDELMEHVSGPDFPTGGTIVGREPIYEAYKTGRGRLRVRAKYEVEERDSGGDRLVITEIPYQTKKERLVEKIAEMVKEDRLDGVSDLRDESNRDDGVRIVIDLKRSAITDVVENKLVDTVLEKTVSVINLALVDGTPKVMSLPETLQHYIDHRREVVRRRSERELEEHEKRAHQLEGRLKVLDKTDAVVDLIQESDDRSDAIEELQTEFDFSEAQADHIVRMQLGSLTSIEAEEVEAEYDEIQDRIERLNTILDDTTELDEVIKDELRKTKEAHANERRTDIITDAGSVEREDLIPEKDIVVVLTKDGYLKRMDAETFGTQHRAGKGVIGTELKQGDRVDTVQYTSTHDPLLCLTNTGDIHKVKGYDLPDFSRTARGTPAVNVLGLDSDERVTAIVSVDEDEFVEDKYLTLVTEQATIKRTSLAEFTNIHSGGIRAINLTGDDVVVDAAITNGDTDLVLGTTDGRAIRFDAEDVRSMGRTASGVNAIKLGDADGVTGFAAVPQSDTDDQTLFTVTENGYGKRTALSKYRQQSRYGKGLLDIETDDRNGKAVSLHAASDAEGFIIMTENGQILRSTLDEVSVVGRNTKGVTVMDLDTDDVVADVAVLREHTDE